MMTVQDFGFSQSSLLLLATVSAVLVLSVRGTPNFVFLVTSGCFCNPRLQDSFQLGRGMRRKRPRSAKQLHEAGCKKVLDLTNRGPWIADVLTDSCTNPACGLT
jgi:hypothetical protein